MAKICSITNLEIHSVAYIPFDCTNSDQMQIKEIGDGWSPCHKTGPSPKHLYDCRAYKPLVIMLKTIPTCRRCNTKLNSTNWYPSSKARHDYICKQCLMAKNKEWYHANPDTAKAQKTRANRKKGAIPMSKNRECSAFLGVHVAEQVLSKVFKHVERMSHNNPGYDFICGKGYKIDVKASCLRKDKKWAFNITKNKMADYFLCIAFDDRKQLTPLHVWLIPGKVVNHLQGTTINKNTLLRWSKYELDINNVIKCCDTMKK